MGRASLSNRGEEAELIFSWEPFQVEAIRAADTEVAPGVKAKFLLAKTELIWQNLRGRQVLAIVLGKGRIMWIVRLCCERKRRKKGVL